MWCVGGVSVVRRWCGGGAAVAQACLFELEGFPTAQSLLDHTVDADMAALGKAEQVLTVLLALVARFCEQFPTYSCMATVCVPACAPAWQLCVCVCVYMCKILYTSDVLLLLN